MKTSFPNLFHLFQSWSLQQINYCQVSNTSVSIWRWWPWTPSWWVIPPWWVPCRRPPPWWVSRTVQIADSCDWLILIHFQLNLSEEIQAWEEIQDLSEFIFYLQKGILHTQWTLLLLILLHNYASKDTLERQFSYSTKARVF